MTPYYDSSRADQSASFTGVQPDRSQSGGVDAPSPIGLSLLMVTFLVLCLFTFAAISLRSAANDLADSRQFADGTSAYYAACNQAEEQLHELNASAAAGEAAEEAVTYTVPVDEQRYLSVTAVLEEDGTYHVREWLQEYYEDWEAPETMALWVPD